VISGWQVRDYAVSQADNPCQRPALSGVAGLIVTP